MYDAQPLPRGAAPGLHHIVDRLAERAGLSSTPAVYYVPTQVANAFAVGRGTDAALAVTDGLLHLLDRRQLVGVLAHEVSHIRNGDTTIMRLSDLIGQLVRSLASVGMWSMLLTLPLTLNVGPAPLLVSGVLIVLPTVTSLMQLSLSRSREYDANLDGVCLTADPEGLAQGLLALERTQGRTWEPTLNPPSRTPDPVVLRSHPDTADRVRQLRELTPEPHEQAGTQDADPPPPRTRRRASRPSACRWAGSGIEAWSARRPDPASRTGHPNRRRDPQPTRPDRAVSRAPRASQQPTTPNQERTP